MGRFYSPKLNWKRYAHAAGGVFAVAGLAFVVVQLRRYGAKLDGVSLSRADWIALLCLVAVGVCMNGCLGLAWRAVLASGGVIVSRRWAVITYAMTHVARYVPGNIFHYASRQAVGMAAGLPARALAQASLLELMMVGGCGALLGLYALPLMGMDFQTSGWSVLLSGFILVALAIIRRKAGHALALAIALYMTYLVASATTFIVIVWVHGGMALVDPDHLTAVGGAYVAAWLIGMITPGAPAGLGIREAVVLFLLRTSMDAPNLLFAVLATRIIAICADALAYFVGAILRRRNKGSVA